MIILFIICLFLRPVFALFHIDTVIIALIFSALTEFRANSTAVSLTSFIGGTLITPIAGIIGILSTVFYITTYLAKDFIDKSSPIVQIVLLSTLCLLLLTLESLLINLTFGVSDSPIKISTAFTAIVSTLIGYFAATVYNRYNVQRAKIPTIRK